MSQIMKQEKVSVLLPVYNTKRNHLVPCVDSILDQTLKNFELVIVDNGSTNQDTHKAIDFYRDQENIKVIQVPQQKGKKNLSVALNQGLIQCENELVARMDSDDYMAKERLEKQLDYFNNNWEDVDILGTLLTLDMKQLVSKKYTDFTRHLSVNIPEVVDQNLYRSSTHFCNHPTIMFKKSVILDLGGYKDTPDHIPEDFCLWAKALKNGYKIRNLQEVLLWYREDGTGLSHQDARKPEWYQAINEARTSLFDFKSYL